jgi:hypothetical protein
MMQLATERAIFEMEANIQNIPLRRTEGHNVIDVSLCVRHFVYASCSSTCCIEPIFNVTISFGACVNTGAPLVESVYLLMALQPLWTLVAFSVFLINTHSVGLLGRGISSRKAATYRQNNTKYRINAHRHPCLEWDSNPRSQRSSERRQLMP